ncbi:hypothetical protein FSP39_020006 [Pinctada imbricata]|uniref:Phospholipid scramblase n=1 Tax=Pinctada imbricata TaxID=66713 RepID=A0AA89C7U5_PINIB|nr:hypothetical protein FSP39_020006 [Pinctada imbricata]
MMAHPGAISGCPPGLEYLTQIDQLIVRQQVDLLEVVVNWEVANRYSIQNSLGQQAYFAQEESDMCQRQCCKQNRGFIMHITDNNGQEVMRCIREFKCCVGCCWCADGSCGWEMSVESPPGNIIGYVRQQTSKWKPHIGVYDANHQMIFRLWGPCCPCQAICCTDDVDITVYDPGMKTTIGRVFKRWDGCIRDAFTNADTFGVQFPMDMDVKAKALLVGCTFFVDFLIFEQQKNNNQ